MDTRIGLWFPLAAATLAAIHGYSVDPSFGGKSVYSPGFGGKEDFIPQDYRYNKLSSAPQGYQYKPPSAPQGYQYKPLSAPQGYQFKTPSAPQGYQYKPPGYSPAPVSKPIFEEMPPSIAAYPSRFGAVPSPHPSKTGNLVERFRWRFVDYEWPSEEARYAAIAQGLYIPENNLPVGIELWQDKMFISVPRWAGGVPATLNYLPVDAAPVDEPRLIPYPDWASNREDDCDALTTTYRIRVDECDRLWVLDSGTVGIGNTTQQVCPYAYHVFDLHTNRRIKKYNLKPEDINANTFIANIAVDVGKTCDDTFVYASDELGYGLIVYDFQKDDSWRFEHGFFFPDPLAGDFNIGGINFQWSAEGIFGMALSAPQPSGFKTVFFHSLASNREFFVSTEILRNKEKVEESYHDFSVLPSRGPGGHVTSQLIDQNGIMFFNLIDQNAVGCWDTRKPYSKENLAVVAKDDVGLIFPSDVRVDRTGTLWVISDRMPVHLEASLDFRDVNFRVFFAPAQALVAGTVCDPSVVGSKVKTDVSQYVGY